MIRTNNPQSKRPYYAIRRLREKMNGSVKKIRAKHPNSVMIYQNYYVVNPINLYKRLKASGILSFNANYCSTKITEAELIRVLGSLCEMKQQ